MSVNQLKSTWWRPLIAASALTALVATPFLFASGVDNDSPFNMPNWTTLNVVGGLSSNGRFANVAPMAVAADVDATVQIVDQLLPKPRLLIDHVKIVPSGIDAPVSNPENASERLLAVSGSDVRLVDSMPTFGNTTVAVQGKFWLSGPAVIGLDIQSLYAKPVSFLVIGKENDSTHQLDSIYQVIPLGYTTGVLDIQKLAKLLAGESSLHGLTAMLACGHLSTSLSGAAQFALDSTVQFQVSTSPKFLIDTDAKLPH